MTLGSGVICSISTKQKINTSSSSEAELVGVDDVVSKVQWMKQFISKSTLMLFIEIIQALDVTRSTHPYVHMYMFCPYAISTLYQLLEESQM
jgi:hypothetical protein